MNQRNFVVVLKFSLNFLYCENSPEFKNLNYSGISSILFVKISKKICGFSFLRKSYFFILKNMAHINPSFDSNFEVINFDPNNPNQKSCKTSLAWRNLRYEVRPIFGAKKVILNRLNGYFDCGSLNGLMGPSGAGKTTLLNCLGGLASAGLSLGMLFWIWLK